MILTSKDKFDTSNGKAFIVECSEPIKAGQQVIIDGEEYTIKRIQMQTTPSDADLIAIFVNSE